MKDSDSLRPPVLEIRQATEADHNTIWDIFYAIVAAGDTYAFDPKISRDEALAYWFRADTRTYVAEEDGRVVGTYILRANQAGHGSHVSNAAFMVAPDVQGSARRLGFRAMQFNFVVSTNEGAIRLWKQLGFKIVGTLPSAFRHPQKGYVDVYVMFRSLEEAGKR